MEGDWTLCLSPGITRWISPDLGGECGVVELRMLPCLFNTSILTYTPSFLFLLFFFSCLLFFSALILIEMGFKDFLKSRSGLRVDNRKTTSAATLTLRQSLWPLTLVTILFFLWVNISNLYYINT